MGLLAEKLKTVTWNHEQIHKLKSSVIQRVLQVASPEKIIWFGSSQRNEMNGLSDFDFAVLFSDIGNLKKGKKDILTNKLFTDVNVDFIFYTSEDFNRKSKIGGICWEVQNQGEVIYDKRTKV